VSSYTLTSAKDAPERDPYTWALLGSNDDGSTWTTLDTRTAQSFTSRGAVNTYSFTNTTGYGVYRLRIDRVADPSSANSVQLAEIELLGVPALPTPARPAQTPDHRMRAVRNSSRLHRADGRVVGESGRPAGSPAGVQFRVGADGVQREVLVR